jgi:type I restriction enzyme, S subunit
MSSQSLKLNQKKDIPEGWKEEKLIDAVDFLDEKRKPIKNSDRSKMKGKYPYYGASGIIDYVDDYIFDDKLIILAEDGENIISRSSRLAFQISGKVWINNHAHVLKPKNGNEPVFLAELLESINYEQYNTGTAQPKLNKKTCSNILIKTPSPLEQTSISKLISDTYQMLRQLDLIIIKKRNIKEWVLQEIFTGKRRLNGFNEDWEIKKLDEITQITSSKRIHVSDYVKNGIPFFRSTEIVGFFKTHKFNEKDFLYISEEKFHNLKSKFGVPTEGDILLTSVGTIGIPFLVPKKLILYFKDGNITWLRKIEDVDSKYLYYFFQTNQFKKQAEFSIGGSTQIALTITKLNKFQILLPKSQKEQTTIANILSDLDAEIHGLEEKRDKYIMIKNGMMQKLLTGKIRLT